MGAVNSRGNWGILADGIKKLFSDNKIKPKGLIIFGKKIDTIYDSVANMKSKLDQTSADGGTPGWEALEAGLIKILRDGEPTNIIIATDGEFSHMDTMTRIIELLGEAEKLGCTINVATTEEAYGKALAAEPRKGDVFLSTSEDGNMEAQALYEAVLGLHGKIVYRKNITEALDELINNGVGTIAVPISSVLHMVHSIYFRAVDKKTGEEIEIEQPVDVVKMEKMNPSASINVSKESMNMIRNSFHLGPKDVFFPDAMTQKFVKEASKENRQKVQKSLKDTSEKWAARNYNAAMTVNNKPEREGGIDLTAANMHVQTRNSGREIKFNLDPAMLQRLLNAPGFVPVIINIQPMTDIAKFLGLNS